MTGFEPQNFGVGSDYSNLSWATIMLLVKLSLTNDKTVIVKMGPIPASFSFIFVFSDTRYNFTTNSYVKKCPSSIWCWYSNSQPLEHEPPPITTRPGLPAQNVFIYKDYRGNGPEHFSLIWNILKKWAIPGLFFFYFLLFMNKISPMTVFEPRTSGVGSDHSATTTAQFSTFVFNFLEDTRAKTV